jgi:hypothetical protein
MPKQRFIGIFDLKTDAVAFAASSATYAASIGADLRSRRNLLDRILSAKEVRSREGLGALILTINLFTLLGAYYLLKTGHRVAHTRRGRGGSEGMHFHYTGDRFVRHRAMRWGLRSPRPVTSIPDSTLPSLQAGGLQIQVSESSHQPRCEFWLNCGLLRVALFG